MSTKIRPLILIFLMLILAALACKSPLAGPKGIVTPLSTPGFATQIVSDQRPDLLFISERDTRGSLDIFGMQADGSNIVRITETTFVFNWGPAWSPDCTQIAFSSNMAGDNQFSIYVMDYGSDQPAKPLLDPQQFVSGMNPTWSPDGRRIAFDGAVPGDSAQAIFVMNTDGSQLERLTQLGSEQLDTCPAWSPDGNYIAYMNSPDGATYYLMVMKPDGSDARQLYTTKYQSGSCPSWSPDSQRIAFPVAGQENYYSDIAIINLDGSGFVKITNSPIDELQPDWSPDGKTITYMIRIPEKSFEIHSMNIDGTGDLSLTDDLVNDHDPDWCPLP